ncbi:TlpA disulfide reductase family protein [Alcanivorax sp. 1008]|uniref:TlpA family protein disulfide reductase n=1 Tax=Alcanivorax sp. 1008 TaxID=2816853 RepID=UPI001D93283E|nr:TlpA disulfide reductase family protein [Alcanivorax sp. 1008]MCC1496594.1 TlpA family protein disulfide reductase [Alcanivorax sp. 1008]
MRRLRFIRTLNVFIALIVAGAALPALSAEQELSAEQFSPALYPEAKVIYLDFWASWCVPCRQSFPWLNEMQAKYAAQGLKIVGINVDRRHADAERFLADHAAHFTLVMDPAGGLAEQYQLQGMPSAVMIGPDGKELARHIGFRADRTDEYEAGLRRLLEEQK